MLTRAKAWIAQAQDKRETARLSRKAEAEGKVMAALSSGRKSMKQIQDLARLSDVEVSRIIGKLMHIGIVEVEYESASTIGYPQTYYYRLDVRRRGIN